MRHYVTLFDINYAAKGIALYRSIKEHTTQDFRLWVLPMDSITEDYLKSKQDIFDKIIPLDWRVIAFEVRSLGANRPWGQFCWTMASHVTKCVLDAVQVDNKEVTYLDSDLYFFANPECAHAERNEKPVAVVPHRFPPHDAERLRPAGLYNVSWVTFTQDLKARAVLDRWCSQVAKYCGPDSCGDQKYLDEWPTLLGDNLHEFKSIGIGAGPWNTYTYEVGEGPTLNTRQLIFYHFHELQRIKGDEYKLTGYPVTPHQKQFIYEPYLRELRRAQSEIDEHLKV